ncbi:MAG TPA: MFS transporter [Gemmatimonadales bacterium]|nr:MFS transporter [Gemmatimonadales bacterium]
MRDPRRGTHDGASAPRAGRREWIGLAVIALPCMLYSMDLTVLNLAVPALSADLRPSASQLLWIVDIYGFMVAGFLITMGTLGDRIGRRRLLLIGATAFGIASIVAAFSSSAGMLIATRALLGIAGATLAPSTLSLIRNMFHDPQQRTTAVGFWITSYSVGAMIGPFLGGLLLQYLWWGSVFLIGVPVMALLLILGPRLLPEFRDPEAGSLDLLSTMMSLAAVLLVIYGLKQTAQDGIQWVAALTIVAGLVVGLAFVRRQGTLAHPLMHLRLFREPAFTASLTAYLLATFVALGIYIFMTQYFQLVLELSPLQAGLWSLPWAATFIVGSNLTPPLARRFRPVPVMVGGLVLAALGFGTLTRVAGSSGLAVLVAGSVVYSLGLAPVFTLTNDFIIGTAPPERTGSASALSETSSELGGALGIAILGSIGTAIYRSQLAGNLPAGTPPEAAVAARSTLGGALAAAERMAGQSGAELLGTARQAFTQALVVTAAVCAIVMLGTAVLFAGLMRHRQVPVQGSIHVPGAAKETQA